MSLSVEGRETINPYRHAAGLVLQLASRIAWDLRIESWVSRRKIKSLKDRYQGEKAVIVCNGPSLLKSDLSLLKGTFTFGLNKINLLFDKSDFRPSCVVAVNRLVIEQNAEFFNSTDIPVFLDSNGMRCVRPRKCITYLHSYNQPKFARDCSMSIYQGATVTFVAMQLAYHMGFKDVALIGCDHTFAEKGLANKTVVSGEKDNSHFDPNYFSGGMKWQLPDLFQSELAYKLARDVYESSGRSLVNATVGGQLAIFPRQSLSDFLRGNGV